MLRILKHTLDLSFPFDACVWAMAACAFWGMMRLGEVTVKSQKEFNPLKHLKRKDAVFNLDLLGKRYARLDLPSAKTAKPGEIQSCFVTVEDNICPLDVLDNLAKIVPALPEDPLFSWRDARGMIRPLVKQKAMDRVNSVFKANGISSAFDHLFRIGGASFFLA
jgi:hypothetical protein